MPLKDIGLSLREAMRYALQYRSLSDSVWTTQDVHLLVEGDREVRNPTDAFNIDAIYLHADPGDSFKLGHSDVANKLRVWLM